MKIYSYLLIFACTLGIPWVVQAQTVIKGHIYTGDRQAIAEVNLTLIKHKQTYRSGTNGAFIFTIYNADTLVVSSIGYQTERIFVAIGDSPELTVLLKPIALSLKEVVVSTGYQEITKQRSTGSYEHVDNQLLNWKVGTNFLDRIDGMVAGILFDKRSSSNADFSVRGLSTLTDGVRQPLVVLDNFPYEGNLNTINPNDIEDITILKDAAAAAIWGTRAGNGVVVINTKKGKFNQGLKISVNSNISIQQKPDIGYLQPIAAADFIEVERMLFNAGFYNSAINNTTSRPVISPVVELLHTARTANETERLAIEKQIDAFKSYDVRNDFLKYIYRNAVSQQYALNLSGGNTKNNYVLAIGYDHNQTNLIGNDNNRLSLRTEQNYKPIKNLDINLGLQYTLVNTFKNSPGGYGDIVSNGGKEGLYPYARFADENGVPLPIVKGYRFSYISNIGSGKLLDWTYSPLQELENADNSARQNDILLKAGLKYAIKGGFSAELRYQGLRSTINTNDFYNTAAYLARNLINRYTVMAGNSVTYNLPYGTILEQEQNVLTSTGIRGQLNFNRELAGGHHFNFLAGAEVRSAERESQRYRDYGFDDNNYTIGAIDYVTRFPIYGSLSSNTAIPFVKNYTGTLNRNVSLYSNLAYTFNNRYSVTGSIRKDASNIFGVESNRKWVPLWSAGLAWEISKENFFKSTQLNYIKFRATYGYSGNVNNAIAAITTLRYTQPTISNSLNGLPYANVTNYPNPNLRWERVAMVNMGIDFNTAQNRIGGSIEYYFKKAIDLISLVPTDRTIGIGGNVSYNSAVLNNSGVDLTINAIPLQEAIQWTSSLIFSYNKNKVARYLYAPTRFTSYVGDGLTISRNVGQSAYNIVSYKWAGLDPATGDPIAYLNGMPSKDYTNIINNAQLNDLVFHGSATPELYGSLRNSLAYKNWTVSFNISWRFNYYFRRNSLNYAGLFASWIGHEEFSSRWQQPGDELKTNVPAMVYPANAQRDQIYDYSSILVEKADHIRLQDIRLGYRSNQPWLAALGLKDMNFYVYANNLGILWRANKNRIDPDVVNGMPPSHTISFGLSTNF